MESRKQMQQVQQIQQMQHMRGKCATNAASTANAASAANAANAAKAATAAKASTRLVLLMLLLHLLHLKYLLRGCFFCFRDSFRIRRSLSRLVCRISFSWTATHDSGFPFPRSTMALLYCSLRRCTSTVLRIW